MPGIVSYALLAVSHANVFYRLILVTRSTYVYALTRQHGSYTTAHLYAGTFRLPGKFWRRRFLRRNALTDRVSWLSVPCNRLYICSKKKTALFKMWLDVTCTVVHGPKSSIRGSITTENCKGSKQSNWFILIYSFNDKITPTWLRRLIRWDFFQVVVYLDTPNRHTHFQLAEVKKNEDSTLVVT